MVYYCLQRSRKGWREEGSEGASEWVLARLLRGADIIKDSPCILPAPSSKGMLAPGSSASYCVALAEKRLCKWLCTAEEEKEERVSGVGGGCFLFTSSEGGYTNNSVCFSTRVHANLSSYALFLFISFLLCLTLSLAVWHSVYFCHPLNISLSLSHSSYFLSGDCVFCLPLLNNAPVSFPSISLPRRLHLCCVFVPWLDLASALSHLAMSVDVCCRCSLGILGKLFACVVAAVTTLAVLRMSPIVCLTDARPPGTAPSPVTV